MKILPAGEPICRMQTWRSSPLLFTILRKTLKNCLFTRIIFVFTLKWPCVRISWTFTKFFSVPSDNCGWSGLKLLTRTRFFFKTFVLNVGRQPQIQSEPGLYPLGLSGRGLKLTPHVRSRLRVSGAIPVLPPHAVIACTGTALPLPASLFGWCLEVNHDLFLSNMCISHHLLTF
jgi:hypothetical protein